MTTDNAATVNTQTVTEPISVLDTEGAETRPTPGKLASELEAYDLKIEYCGYSEATDQQLSKICEPGQNVWSGYFFPTGTRDITFEFKSDEARKAAIKRLDRIATRNNLPHNAGRDCFKFLNRSSAAE